MEPIIGKPTEQSSAEAAAPIEKTPLTPSMLRNTWRDLKEFVVHRGHKRNYFSKEIEEALVVVIAGTLALNGMIPEESIQAVPSERKLHDEKDKGAESNKLAKDILANPILRLFVGEDDIRARTLRYIVKQHPIAGDALRYYYLEASPPEEVLHKPRAAMPVTEYPADDVLFGGKFALFMRGMCSSLVPSLITDENIERTCFYKVPEAKKFEDKHHVPFFDISAISRRRIRALVHAGVSPTEPLAQYVACSAMMVGSRQTLHDQLVRKLEYLFTLSPIFGGNNTRVPGKAESFVRSSLHNGIIQNSFRVRMAANAMEELSGKLRETYELVDDKAIARFNTLLYHRPSQLSDISKSLSRLSSYYIYRKAIEAIRDHKPEELEFIDAVFKLSAARAVALNKDRISLKSDSVGELPDTGTIIGAMFAPKERLVTLLIASNEQKRKELLAAMADELTALIANFDSISFPDPLSPELEARLLDELIQKIDYLGEISSEITGVEITLNRPLTKRDELIKEARELSQDSSRNEEIIAWCEERFKIPYIDQRNGDRITPLRITYTDKFRPMLIVEKFSSFDITESKVNPWHFRLRVESGLLGEKKQKNF